MSTSFDAAINPKNVPIAVKTAAWAILATDVGTRFIYTGAASVTATLPTTGISAGWAFYIKNNSLYTVTLGTSGIKILAKQECLVVWDGSAWQTFGLQKRVPITKTVLAVAAGSVAFFLPPDYEQFDIRVKNFAPVSGAGDNGFFRIATDAAGTAYNSGNNYYRGSDVINGPASVSSQSVNTETLAYFAYSVTAGGPATYDINLTPGGDLNVPGGNANTNWIWKGGAWDGTTERAMHGSGFATVAGLRATGIIFGCVNANMAVGTTFILEGIA